MNKEKLNKLFYAGKLLTLHYRQCSSGTLQQIHLEKNTQETQLFEFAFKILLCFTFYIEVTIG